MVFGSIYKISLKKKGKSDPPIFQAVYVTYVKIKLETTSRDVKQNLMRRLQWQ